MNQTCNSLRQDAGRVKKLLLTNGESKKMRLMIRRRLGSHIVNSAEMRKTDGAKPLLAYRYRSNVLLVHCTVTKTPNRLRTNWE
jgi:hypothetical protein